VENGMSRTIPILNCVHNGYEERAVELFIYVQSQKHTCLFQGRHKDTKHKLSNNTQKQNTKQKGNKNNMREKSNVKSTMAKAINREKI